MYSQHPAGSRPPGTIDFELTDVSDARQALDDLPPGVREREQLEPGYWESRRRKPTPADRALTGAALDWLMKLPADVRPQVLCEQYPRIVNLIAQAWADAVGTDRLFARLLGDDRGGRRGFPADVERELRLVAQFRANRRP